MSISSVWCDVMKCFCNVQMITHLQKSHATTQGVDTREGCMGPSWLSSKSNVCLRDLNLVSWRAFFQSWGTPAGNGTKLESTEPIPAAVNESSILIGLLASMNANITVILKQWQFCLVAHKPQTGWPSPMFEILCTFSVSVSYCNFRVTPEPKLSKPSEVLVRVIKNSCIDASWEVCDFWYEM